MFGVHGLCGQRALLVVVQEPERENDHATALLLDMVENPALVQSDKWVIAIIDLAQVKKRNVDPWSNPSGGKYSWFASTWRDGHFGVQNNRKWPRKFLHNNKVKFPKDILLHCSVHQHGRCDVRWKPFSSSCLPPLQSESKCEVFVMVISSTLHMNENYFW